LKFETVTSGMCQTHYDRANHSVERQLKQQKKTLMHTYQKINKLFNETAWDRNDWLIRPSWFAETAKIK